MSQATSKIATFEAIVQAQAAEAPKRTRKIRQPVRPLAPSAETIAAQAKTEAARKKASKKALAESRKPKAEAPKRTGAPTKSADAKAAEHAAYVAALRVDAEALGVDPDTYVAEQLTDAPKITGYVGPMLALRTAVKKYVKAENGQPCNGDELALACGRYSREAVVAGLIAAMGLGANPYPHLNPGQQSMNLRNKARAQVKSGQLQMAAVEAALARAA